MRTEEMEHKERSDGLREIRTSNVTDFDSSNTQAVFQRGLNHAHVPWADSTAVSFTPVSNVTVEPVSMPRIGAVGVFRWILNRWHVVAQWRSSVVF